LVNFRDRMAKLTDRRAIKLLKCISYEEYCRHNCLRCECCWYYSHVYNILERQDEVLLYSNHTNSIPAYAIEQQ
jgi:hypothetical protein